VIVVPLSWTPPPPTYPEYSGLLQAARASSRFVDPARVHVPEAIASRRGCDWATAVIGRPYHGLRSVSSVEAKLIELADAAEIGPALPQWLLDERGEQQTQECARQQRKAEALARQQQVWADARAACPVPLEVRENTNSRGYGERREPLRHAVPTEPAVSDTRRAHPAGRPLCVTSSRRPMPLGEPVEEPATCLRCLDWTGKVRAPSEGES
jgi:hypothetical protein